MTLIPTILWNRICKLSKRYGGTVIPSTNQVSVITNYAGIAGYMILPFLIIYFFDPSLLTSLGVILAIWAAYGSFEEYITRGPIVLPNLFYGHVFMSLPFFFFNLYPIELEILFFATLFVHETFRNSKETHGLVKTYSTMLMQGTLAAALPFWSTPFLVLRNYEWLQEYQFAANPVSRTKRSIFDDVKSIYRDSQVNF